MFREFYGRHADPTTYEGFCLKSELEAVEQKFKINLFVYQEQEAKDEERRHLPKQVVLVHSGTFQQPKERNVNLLLTGGTNGEPLHLVWIKQCDRFLKRLACKFCGKLVKDVTSLEAT